MSVPVSYISVIFIWATTPLAIKWSAEGPGFLLGVTGRMVLGLMICLALVKLFQISLHWKIHRLVYLVSGLTIYGAMMSVYWGAQTIPSGLISVIYGLSPIMTGVMAALWMQEGSLTPVKVLGIGMGIAGLAFIFRDDLTLSSQMLPGMGAVLLSTFLHSFGGVALKKIGMTIHPLAMVTGGLSLAVPLFLATALMSVDMAAVTLTLRSVLAITYLGTVATVLGFALYFYVLSRVSATQVALITLITPVLALLIGAHYNGELVTPAIWMGTAIIINGLSIYLWGDRVLAKLPRLKGQGV